MNPPLPDLERALGPLKDFQRRTVDYVFKRLYLDDDPAHRFLLADEVGLGKTLVAKGIIARAVHHLTGDTPDDHRIDVVYVCSNQDIARQNLNRLNLTNQEEVALPTRLTLLATQVHHLEGNHLNFVSLTPGTSLETMKSRGGRKRERVLLYRMLKGLDGLSRGGLRNLLQNRVHRENWMRDLKRMEFRIDSSIESDFLRELRSDRELWTELVETAEDFRWRTDRDRIPKELNQRRLRVLAKMRRLLAGISVDALEPDLIILDEFQRFRDLLDGDTEAAQLTRQLLNYQEESGHRARVLLLSATPYRMLSLYDEEEDHYEDFLRTCRFLFDDSAEREERLKRDLSRYRRGLLNLRNSSSRAGSGWSEEAERARSAVEEQLSSVMARTERTSSTGSENAMLEDRPIDSPLAARDLEQARSIDRVARAVDSYDPIKYWKSAPYLLSLMRDYKLREAVDDRKDAAPPELLEALGEGEGHLLRERDLERYREIDPANGRLRALVEETLEAGQWRLLWMPPSLPYLEPSGPYEDLQGITKSLIFSSWRVVPDAVAALLSYGAERRMVHDWERQRNYGDLSDITGPIRFQVDSDGRPSGMNPIMLLYPSPTLAELGDPLRLASESSGDRLAPAEAMDRVESRVRERLSEAGVTPDYEGYGVADQRWYRTALARLDAQFHPTMEDWVTDRAGWERADPENVGSYFDDHVRQFAEGYSAGRTMGHAPEDLPRVLAALALASPAVCAYRALRRVADVGEEAHDDLLAASVRVANAFRTLFNLPETVGLLQRDDGDLRYWERALRYGIRGNLQAVLDEYTHVLRESLGLIDAGPAATVRQVSESIREALALGTGRTHVDDLRPRPEQNAIDVETFRIRTRFAQSFGQLRDESGERVARRGDVREAFNSPFRPFVLATTSIGQEGLDFHTYCHAVWHWNLPTNPVDLEQREGRVHRYKGHAIRKNVAEKCGSEELGGDETDQRGSIGLNSPSSVERHWEDPWRELFRRAEDERPSPTNDLVPYWIFDDGPHRVERRVPLLPMSREVSQLKRLKKSLAVYRMVFGQPRQEDLLEYLNAGADQDVGSLAEYRISLEPGEVEVDQSTEEVRNSTQTGAGRTATFDSERRPRTPAELVDRIRKIVEDVAPEYDPNYTRDYLGFELEGRVDNFVALHKRKYGVRLDVRLEPDHSAIERADGVGLEVLPHREYETGPGQRPIKIRPGDFTRHRDLIETLVRSAYLNARLK